MRSHTRSHTQDVSNTQHWNETIEKGEEEKRDEAKANAEEKKTCVFKRCGIHVTVIQAIHSLKSKKSAFSLVHNIRDRQIVFVVISVLYTAYELKLNTCIEIKKMLHEENSIYTVNQIDLNAQHNTHTSHHDFPSIKCSRNMYALHSPFAHQVFCYFKLTF